MWITLSHFFHPKSDFLPDINQKSLEYSKKLNITEQPDRYYYPKTRAKKNSFKMIVGLSKTTI
jgi:hypothetical protein